MTLAVRNAVPRDIREAIDRIATDSGAPVFPTTDVLGVPVALCTEDEFVEALTRLAHPGRRLFVSAIHTHGMNLACRHRWLHDLYRTSRLAFCDSVGVRIGARILGHGRPPRFTSADWIWHFCARATDEHIGIFLLGGESSVVAAAADALRRRFPGLAVGAHHGYFDKYSPENDAVLDAIRAARPGVLFVGFGKPDEDRWAIENWDALADVPVVIPIGAMVDWITGRKRRAPGWMRRLGLEWLHRLLQEPRRLFRRYVVGNPAFILRVMRARLTGWRPFSTTGGER